MTNAQSNLAALGTKPIQFNLGEIYLNQMNYLAKTKGEEEAARAKARAERAKDVGDFSAKYSALDYKNVPDYVLNQYNQSFNDAIEDNNRITRELQAGLIDQTEAGRQYAKNKNIPEQISAFAESVKTSYEQMRDGKGDPILNAEREAFLKNIASGGFALKRGEDGTQQVYLKDPDGTERPYSMSEVGMKLNTEWQFYDKEYNTEDYAKSLADNAKTIKTDTGYIQSEKVSFANSKDAIKNAIKSSVSSFSEYDNWSPEIKKAYKEKNGIYARPKDEKDVDDFIEDFTDKRVRVHFKEVDSTGKDPLMKGKLEKQTLDIEGARLGNQGKKISNARGKVALGKDLREENEFRPTPTITYIDENNWDKGKGGLKSGAYAFPKGKEFSIWLDDNNPEYKVKNVIIRDGGRMFVEKDGVKGKEQIEIKSVSDKNSISKGLGRDGWDQFYEENQEFIKKDTRPSRNQPKTTFQKAKDAVVKAVGNGKKYLPGRTNTSTNKSKATKQYPL